MCYVEKMPVLHKYQLELIIPKDDSLIWNDTEKAIDHILSKSSAVITDLTYDDDEDEVTVILSYETESKLSYSDSYSATSCAGNARKHCVCGFFYALKKWSGSGPGLF